MLRSGKQIEQWNSLKEGKDLITNSPNHYRPGERLGNNKLDTIQLYFCSRKGIFFNNQLREVPLVCNHRQLFNMQSSTFSGRMASDFKPAALQLLHFF